jgi:hypothetical protein
MHGRPIDILKSRMNLFILGWKARQEKNKNLSVSAMEAA